MSNNNISGNGKVWARFESKKPDGSIVKLRIEDLPSERLDEAFDYLKTYYVPTEAFHKAAGIHKSEESLNEYRELLNLFYKDNPCRVVYCCIDDDKPAGEIIGLSFMQMSSKTENKEEFFNNTHVRTKEMVQFFHIVKALDDFFSVKEFDKYYDGRGIIVDPKYRGLGIANEFVRVRKLICIDENVPVTTAWMTAIGTQKAAEKNNWKTMAEISAEELGKRSGTAFENKITFKMMYTTVD